MFYDFSLSQNSIFKGWLNYYSKGAVVQIKFGLKCSLTRIKFESLVWG